jgi:hypothetical protein
MAGAVTKTGEFSHPSAGALDPAIMGKLVGKRRCRNIGVRYSVYSVNVRFWNAPFLAAKTE